MSNDTPQPFPCRGAQAGFIAGYVAGLRGRHTPTPEALRAIEPHAKTAGRILFCRMPVDLTAAAALFDFFGRTFEAYHLEYGPLGKQPADPNQEPDQL